MIYSQEVLGAISKLVLHAWTQWVLTWTDTVGQIVSSVSLKPVQEGTILLFSFHNQACDAFIIYF